MPSNWTPFRRKRRPSGRSRGDGLRQTCAGVRLHKPNVGTVDLTINGYVLAEVTQSHRLSGLRLRLSNVARVNQTVAGSVPREDAHWNRNISAVEEASDSKQVDVQSLSVA